MRVELDLKAGTITNAVGFNTQESAQEPCCEDEKQVGKKQGEKDQQPKEDHAQT